MSHNEFRIICIHQQILQSIKITEHQDDQTSGHKLFYPFSFLGYITRYSTNSFAVILSEISYGAKYSCSENPIRVIQ